MMRRSPMSSGFAQATHEAIQYRRYPVSGVEAMSASTARSFVRHTHDQYGVGVIDSGGHASLSDRGQVAAGPRDLICVNPGEVHDGRAIRGQQRQWRMLYFDPTLIVDAFREGKLIAGTLAFRAPVFKDESLR